MPYVSTSVEPNARRDPAYPRTLAEAADRYCNAGWWLLLTGPGHKRPAWRFHDVHDATLDAGLLAAYIQETPGVGLAVNLAKSGLVSIEDDSPEGLEQLAELERQHEPLTPTWEIQSRRGRHRLYRTNRRVFGRDLAVDLELKALGQYILLPPTTVQGVRRKWIPDTIRRPLAELPDWIARPAQPEAEPEEIFSTDWLAQAAVTEARIRLRCRPTQRGTGRGRALFAAACELGRHVHAGTLKRETAETVLQEAGAALRLSAYERDRSIQRGLQLGPQRRSA